MPLCAKVIIFILIISLSYYLILIWVTPNISKTIIGGYVDIISSIFGNYDNEITQRFLDIISRKGKTVETIDDLNNKMVYYSSKKNDIRKLGCHIGQRKLFLTEVQFLTKVKDVKYCIYAGSAPKHTMLYLSQLFPNIRKLL